MCLLSFVSLIGLAHSSALKVAIEELEMSHASVYAMNLEDQNEAIMTCLNVFTQKLKEASPADIEENLVDLKLEAETYYRLIEKIDDSVYVSSTYLKLAETIESCIDEQACREIVQDGNLEITSEEQKTSRCVRHASPVKDALKELTKARARVFLMYGVYNINPIHQKDALMVSLMVFTQKLKEASPEDIKENIDDLKANAEEYRLILLETENSVYARPAYLNFAENLDKRILETEEYIKLEQQKAVSQSGNNTGLIIGFVAGVLLLAVLASCFRRSRKFGFFFFQKMGDVGETPSGVRGRTPAEVKVLGRSLTGEEKVQVSLN
jgi:hypothetical protein